MMTELEQLTTLLSILGVKHTTDIRDPNSGTMSTVEVNGLTFLFTSYHGRFQCTANGASKVEDRIDRVDSEEVALVGKETTTHIANVTALSEYIACGPSRFVKICFALSKKMNQNYIYSKLAMQLALNPAFIQVVDCPMVDTSVELVITDNATIGVHDGSMTSASVTKLGLARLRKAIQYNIPVVILDKDE